MLSDTIQERTNSGYRESKQIEMVAVDGEGAKVASTELVSLFNGFLKLAILAGGVLYSGLVLMSYRTEGPQQRLRIDLKDPARSAERLLVWLGVKIIALMVRMAIRLFAMLAEASAEVGEWFLRRHAPETQSSFRSRFLV